MNPLISFNKSIDFVRRFHWFCFAELPLLLHPSIAFTARFQQFCFEVLPTRRNRRFGFL